MDRERAVRELRAQIHSYLRGETTFSQFEGAYIAFYIDNAVDSEFSDADHAAYGALFERLQWTSLAPSGLERASGYHSIAETDAWIRDRFQPS